MTTEVRLIDGKEVVLITFTPNELNPRRCTEDCASTPTYTFKVVAEDMSPVIRPYWGDQWVL